MAKKVFCDRCSRAIELNDPIFSGKLPSLEANGSTLKIGGQEQTLGPSLGVKERDICGECIKSFISWWDHKDPQPDQQI